MLIDSNLNCENRFRDISLPESKLCPMKLYLFFILLFIGVANQALSENLNFKTRADSLSHIAKIQGASPGFYEKYLDLKGRDMKSAVKYGELIVNNISSRIPDRLIAEIYVTIAGYYADSLYKFSKAIECYSIGVDMYKSLGDNIMVAELEYCIARSYVRSGYINKALPHVITSVQLAKAEGADLIIRKCSIILGNIYYSSRNFDKALEYYQSVLVNVKTRDERYQMVVALNNIASYRRYQKDSMNALSLSRECIRLCRENGFRDLIYPIYDNINQQFLELGRLDSAAFYIDKMSDRLDNIWIAGMYYRALGKLHLRKGDVDKSIHYLNCALEEFKQGEFNSYILDCLYVMYMSYKSQGNYRSATDAIDEYNEVLELISSEQVIAELYQVENRINLQKEQSLYDSLQNKYELSVIFMTAVIIIFVMSFLLFNMSRKNRILREKQKAELEKLKKEKEFNEMDSKRRQAEYDLQTKAEILKIKKLEIHQGEMLISGVVQRLQQLSSELKNSEYQETVNKVISELQEVNNKEAWDEVEKYITEMNTTFFNNLIAAYPALTVNERKLCIFLHMNMSTKEISAITKQNVNTIITARSRLRKKLNITDPNVSIVAFLQQFN